MKIWFCKIGETDPVNVPAGGDLPMRLAVERAYRELTGNDPSFCFSGWAGALTEPERAVVENRLPRGFDKPVNTEHPLFESIWRAIKDWDLQRSHGLGYASATGTDVQTIIDAIESAPQKHTWE